MKLDKLSGYYVGTQTRYYNHMTRLLGIITKEGIVVGTDGRSVDKDHKFLSDVEVKMYEMSPLCTILVSGQIFDGFSQFMNGNGEIYKQYRNIEVSHIAKSQSEMFKHISKHPSDWLDNPGVPIVFIIAGYDINEEGNFVPHLYYMQKPDWELQIPKPNPLYAQAGNNYQKSKKILESKYKSNMSINQANSLAVEVIDKAAKDVPIFIGGKTKLWNIIPGKPIEKYSQQAIKIFRDAK